MNEFILVRQLASEIWKWLTNIDYGKDRTYLIKK